MVRFITVPGSRPNPYNMRRRRPALRRGRYYRAPVRARTGRMFQRPFANYNARWGRRMRMGQATRIYRAMRGGRIRYGR